MEIKPSCYYCMNADQNPGFGATREDPGEPPSADCQHEQYAHLQEDALENAAQNCPGFLPEPAGCCCNCGESIHSPAYLWKLFAPTLDDHAIVCSESCKAELTAKTRQAEAEMERLEQEAIEFNRRYSEEQSLAWWESLSEEERNHQLVLGDLAYDASREQRSL